MRAVEKGKSPKTYTKYPDAKADLADTIGWYCSYCEMPLMNMPEVEHVVPQSKKGQKVDWDNFLLACRYCNNIKSNRNNNRNDYLFPDQDNTSIAFQYSKHKVIEPKPNLTPQIKQYAQKTIDLCGLDRTPYHQKLSQGDNRWRSRMETWNIAELSLKNYSKYLSKEMLSQIVLTALGHGHYSIWTEVFKQYPEFKKQLDLKQKGTYITQYDKLGNPIKRKGGKI